MFSTAICLFLSSVNQEYYNQENVTFTGKNWRKICLIQKLRRVWDHCHSTGKFRRGARSISNLQYGTLKTASYMTFVLYHNTGKIIWGKYGKIGNLFSFNRKGNCKIYKREKEMKP